jgi:uncharacterized protein involved in exopolysaccharide biosynthesis
MEAQDIVKYFKIIRKWWWVIALLFGTTVGVMMAITLLSETEYEAVAKVQVTAPPPQEGPLFGTFRSESLQDAIAQTQTSFSEFLQEGDVTWRIVEIVPESGMSGGELRDRIEIEIPDASQLMQIKVRAGDPELAAELTNALVEVGLEEYGVLLAQPTANTRDFIVAQLEIAQQELNEAENALVQFQIENRIGNLNRALDNQYDLISRSKGEVDRLRAAGELEQSQVLELIILEREAELQTLIGISDEYSALTDRVARARTNYSFLLDTLSEARIKENQLVELGSIQLINRARIPNAPATAISSRLIVLGALASLFAGILLAFMLEYMEISGSLPGQGIKRDARQAEMAVLSDNVR